MKRLVMCVVLFMALMVNAVSAESIDNDSGKILVLPKCPVGGSISVEIGDAEFIQTNEGKVIRITDLLSFSDRNEATQYVQGLKKAIQNPCDHNATIDFSARATHGDALVRSITYNYLNTLALRVEYTTSGDANTGKITYHRAYTTFSGFTLGIAWNEITCNSQVTASGKDIYASANGELAYYLLIEGLIELGRESVNLSGYCYAVR